MRHPQWDDSGMTLSLVWYLIVDMAGRKIGERLFDRLPTLSDQVLLLGILYSAGAFAASTHHELCMKSL
jgi:hypothetical protein